METLHAEGDSPFIVKEDASVAAVLSYDEEDVIQYAHCPVEGCGEALLLTELESHIEMHGAEEQDTEDDSGPASKKIKLDPGIEASFDTKLSYALRNLGDDEESTSENSSSERQIAAKSAWKGLLKMPETLPKVTASSASGRRRLGVSLSSVRQLPTHVISMFSQKSELGPHANEKQMPSWLVKLLESDGAVTTVNRLDGDGRLKKVKVCLNQASGVGPVLKQLLNQDLLTEYAFLCHPAVKHISKLRKEGKSAVFGSFVFLAKDCRWVLWIPQHTDDVFVHYRSRVTGS